MASPSRATRRRSRTSHSTTGPWKGLRSRAPARSSSTRRRGPGRMTPGRSSSPGSRRCVLPKRPDLRSMCVIGSGPIVIGQACEFDYAGSQALKVLRAEGFRTIVVNSNPATIMTDPGFADRTYLEPLDLEGVAAVLARERPDALLPTLGGQTALNVASALAEEGLLMELGVELIGASHDAIRRAEDRQLFRSTMREVGLRVPESTIVTTPDEAPADLHFPVILRPAFTLGGHGGGIAQDQRDFARKLELALAESPVGQVLLEESLIGWDEFELEVMRDGRDNVVVVCSIENLDPMGVHTGDSITVAPQMTLPDDAYQELRDAAARVIRAVGVDTGGSNIQFARERKTGELRVIEMNPRVSRSSALASKATGYPIAKVAAKLAVGYMLDEIPNDLTGTTPASFEPTLDYVVVKFPRFAFEKFPGADTTLGTQMKSVGEAMGIGRTFVEAYRKAERSRELDSEERWELPGSAHPWFHAELAREPGWLDLDAAVADDFLRYKRSGLADGDIGREEVVRALGYEAVMVNCTPETVSTDYDTSDRLYFEPLRLEEVLAVCEREQPAGVAIQFGGQTPLKLARGLEAAGFPIIGTPFNAVDVAEDRERFGALLERLGIRCPEWGIAGSNEEAAAVAERIGLPVLIRPSYVLGGRAMRVCYSVDDLGYIDRPVLIDRFLESAIEIDVDAVSDGEETYVGAVMQHVEEAGIHSGDSACVLPAPSLTRAEDAEIRAVVRTLGRELGVVGLINVQLALVDETLYVLEANPRASRTVPFASKATGVNLVQAACRVMAGAALSDLHLPEGQSLGHVSVKAAVLPFARFPGADSVLGPEMRATGEVMATAADLPTALAKAERAAGRPLPTSGTAFLSVRDEDKPAVVPIGAALSGLGFRLVATEGTARTLAAAGLEVEEVAKVADASAGDETVVDLVRGGRCDLVVNTPQGRGARADGYLIREAALVARVPCITTIAGAAAAVHAIANARAESALSLQERLDE